MKELVKKALLLSGTETVSFLTDGRRVQGAEEEQNWRRNESSFLPPPPKL